MALSAGTFQYLEQLAANNDRTWFEANRERYERDVREPALALVRALGAQLAPSVPSFEADDRKVGGSLMRIHRDTRFSKDKSPYKTNIGIQLRHTTGDDVHAPGIYVHFAPEECFVGVGLWQPEPAKLEQVRQHIVARGETLTAALRSRTFTRTWSVDLHTGDTLKRPPKGYPADHPMIELLKRKSHLATSPLTQRDATSEDLANRIARKLEDGLPYLQFLCDAVGLPL